MIKKISIFTFLISTVLFFSSFVLATDNSNLGDELKSSFNQAGNSMSNMKNAAGNVGNTITGAIRNTGDTMQNAPRANTGYVATRAAVNDTWMGMNATTWIWLILGIVAFTIVLLSWYYMSNSNKEKLHHNE